MALCMAIWLSSLKELQPLIIALTYRFLHVPNVSFHSVQSVSQNCWFLSGQNSSKLQTTWFKVVSIKGCYL